MFTDEELAAFFGAADSIGAEYRSPFREYTIPVIFRLILGAGLLVVVFGRSEGGEGTALAAAERL